MTRFAIALLVSTLLTLFAEQAVAEGRRVALVIGVSAYESVPQLPNATNDATAIAELFRKANFDVVTARSDVTNLQMKRAIREFEDAAADSDIAVVFYAGHGIEIRESNYLIPADAKLVNERDAEDEAIALDRIITALEPAKRLRLVILDACRDNPFASKMRRRVATRAVSPGLARVEPAQTDTLIAYAAKEKQVAGDGEGQHSPFTTALLANLTVPGLDVRLAFGRVRDDVLRATNRQQEPFVYGSLGGGTVALVPARIEVAAAPTLSIEAAKSDYEIVERVGKKEAWEVFLNTHKTGLYADLARVQLAKLTVPGTDTGGAARVLNDGSAVTEPKASVSPKAAVPAIAPVPKPTAAEQRAWDKLKTSMDRAALAKFLETYPTSPLVPEVQARLETVERMIRDREEAARIEREAARQREEEDKQRKAAEAERKRLEREAAKQREEAERAKAAELARQKAEAQAAAKQKEAEERARVAEEAARKREEEEAARVAAAAARKREAEERAKVLAAERQKAEAEATARKREAEEAARAAIAARLAREAEEQAKAQAMQAQEREARAKAAAAAEKAAEEAARVKADEIAARQLEAEDRRKAAEAASKLIETETAAKDLAEQERAKTAEAERLKARAAAEAERRKAEVAAAAVAAEKAERAAAARRREQAERAREAAEEAAAATRRKAQEAARRAAERQTERAAEAAEQRRRAAQQAKDAARARAAQAARPAPAPRPRAEAKSYSAPAPRSSGGGGGAAPMVGIGF